MGALRARAGRIRILLWNLVLLLPQLIVLLLGRR